MKNISLPYIERRKIWYPTTELHCASLGGSAILLSFSTPGSKKALNHRKYGLERHALRTGRP